MTGKLGINERVVAESYRRVSRESELEAKTLGFAGVALNALADPALQTREAIFARLIELREGEPVTLDRQAEIGIEQELGRAAARVEAIGLTAERSVTDAAEMAEQVEQHGLPQ